MKNVYKLKWALLFLLFGMVANANAQTLWQGTINGYDVPPGQTINVKLTGDVDMRGIVVVQGNLTLDLNGYVLKRNGHSGYLCVITTNGVLTIKDSRPNVAHYGKPSTFYSGSKGFRCEWEYNASYTASTSGAIRIDGGIMNSGFGFLGGGVCCYGTLIMNGGTIAGNNVASCDYYEKVGDNWVLRISRPNTCDEMRTAWEGFINPHGCYKYFDINDPNSVMPFNQCWGEGGGVYVGPQGSFTMNGGRICYNYSSFHGGGVYAGGPFIMSGSSSIDHNYAAAGYGAGVFISHSNEYQPCVNGIPYTAPACYDYYERGYMTMNNGTISYNNAYGGSGGGIMAWFYSSVNVINGNIHHNLALGQRHKDLGNGGGVYCENATFTAKRVVITDNECARTGGGLVVYNESHLDMTQDECIIARNIARPRSTDIWLNTDRKGRGGGLGLVWNGSTATLGNKAAIYDNEAQYGGGAYVTGAICTLQGAIIRNNIADVDGGGFYILSSSDTYVTQNSKILNNTATSGRGGGLFIQASSSTYTQTNSELSNNTAGSHGGGVFMNTGTVSLTGSRLNNNKSTNGNGGGVYAGTGQIIVDNTILYKNKAENGGGGGIFANLGSSGIITIKNNSIMCKNGAKNGGGLYTQSGTIAFQGGTIGGNTASVSGGGVYANYPVNLSGGIVGKTTDTIAGNTAVNGGGIYANSNVTMNSGRISGNSATNGGGVYVASGEFKLTNGIVGGLTSYSLGNYTTGSDNKGGGLYVSGGTATIQGGSIIGNHADNGSGGGIYMNGGTCTLSNGATIGGEYSTYANSAKYGGGIAAAGGTITVKGGNIQRNTASTAGGGIYTNGASSVVKVERQNSILSYIEYNSAAEGGGIYASSGAVNFSDGYIQYNTANNAGGGLYMGGGTTTISGGSLKNNSTTGSGSYGGGIYMNGGTATLTGGAIFTNSTNEGYGGGVYMNGGTCTLSNGATIGGASSSYANSARFGGGIYSAGGDIIVNGGHIDYNTATADGGGIYSNGPTATVRITKEGSALSYLLYNTAVNGGGIYANRGTVEFTDGNVNYNYASNEGGGMYVNDDGTLYLKGNAILSRNHIPTGKKGGGVYLRGTVVVGQTSKAQSIVKAEDNFAHTLSGSETVLNYTPTTETRNNIYLPEPVANPYTSTMHRDVITVIENGIGLTSHVGFSVPHNHVPVIYCQRSSTSWNYLNRFTTGPEHDLNTVLFDDTEHYLSVHYTDWPEAFDPDHVYLYGFWPEAVTNLSQVPDNGFTVDGNTVTISNKEGLAWLISYVNGLNNSEPHNSADLVVNLEADVDMKDFGWVPIGFRGVSGVTPKPFNGTFNGNGHLIEGVNGMVYGQGENGVVDYGLFGYVTGGTIQDVFVKGMEYYTDNNGDLILGGLIGENTGGTVSNSEVQSKLVSQSAQTLIGGLVGRQTGGTLHSSIGIADMTGGRMGGLVGELAGGDLYNSFANSKFTSKDTNKYSGGLVAVNGGTVENCYARLRGDVPSGNFGILVGDNTDGEVNYCYAPAGMTNYKAAGAAPTGHGNYGDSFLPYLYRHRDTQVSLADSDNNYVPTGDDVDKQMLIALNNWVNEMSTEDMAYTKWGRPWQESETNKPLNDDYPILKMPLNDAVAAKTGDPYLYYSPIDTLLVKYTAADEAIWKYRTTTDTVRGDNSTSASKLYIAEDVVLINQTPLKAYVGITLDNSAGVNGANPTYFDVVDATDWHMISTPLSNAPIGIDYTTDSLYEFDEGHPSGMPYYRFYLKNNPKHGYFPSHRFGKDYPASDASIEDGNYYNEWDFYAYYEPKYHWINFKRNSASHHVYGDDDHETINYYGDGVHYGNEARLIPGKGYFAATREETFLQCYGALNNGSVEYNNLTQTTGVPRHGYNLLGNPYQAYLDFNAFAEANSHATMEDAIWYTPEAASYTILDEDELVTNDSVETAVGKSPVFYKTFAYESSSNPDVGAGRFIHPHQGFFVLLRGRSNAAATFEPVMRNASDTVSAKFRGQDHIDYPLVNLFAIEESGAADVVTVELGRPTPGGAQVMHGLRTGNGKIWCHYNDEDYAIAYTQPGISEVSIRFESAEDTEYTMRWSTRNGEFSYLHLIDNLTGANVDCLNENEYKFSSRTSDYTSRFKLVFGYTGIEEDSEAEATQTFAFMMGDEMVVNGEGVLQVFDVNGRLVTSRELQGVQSTVALPEVANGIYVLRLTEGKQSRVQKMVISK